MNLLRRPSVLLFLIILAVLDFAGGFHVYGYIRVMYFSPTMSWPSFWRGILGMSLCGAFPVGIGIVTCILGRALLFRRPGRTAMGACATCSYELGIAGLERCPECGQPLAAPVTTRRFPVTFTAVTAVALAIVLGALAGALVSNTLIRRDERAFLNEVAAHRSSPQSKALYGRPRAWPHSGHRLNFYQGQIDLTD